MITAVRGVRLGHWSDPVALTGCTVALLPAGTVASGEVRGGAPGTREWALLDPRRLVDRVDAVVMSGGSAFGLAACDGVVRWCEERGIGWPSVAGPVPVVVGMVVYDLAVGDPSVRPGPDAGYAACVAARGGGEAEGIGPVGAGTGATVGKWRGAEHRRPGGLGSAVARAGDVTVAATLVVNALGDPADRSGPGLERPRLPASDTAVTSFRHYVAGGEHPEAPPTAQPGEATTVGVIVTDGAIDKLGCRLMAESGHDGLSRALDPVHTGADGDALVAAATGGVDASLEVVRALAAWVVERAVKQALGG